MAAGQLKVSAVERQVFLARSHALGFHVHFVGRPSTLRLCLLLIQLPELIPVVLACCSEA